MTRRFRSIVHAAAVTALAASLGLVALPGAAHARHDHDDSDTEDSDRHFDERHERDERRVYRPGRRHSRYERSHRRRSYRVHVHGDHCRARYAPIRQNVRREFYHCGPCGHRFDSRSGFHRHLTFQHRIPVWQLRHVIVHSTLGWVFHG